MVSAWIKALMIGVPGALVLTWAVSLFVTPDQLPALQAGQMALIDPEAPIVKGSSVSASDISFFFSMAGGFAAVLTIGSWLLMSKK